MGDGWVFGGDGCGLRKCRGFALKGSSTTSASTLYALAFVHFLIHQVFSYRLAQVDHRDGKEKSSSSTRAGYGVH